MIGSMAVMSLWAPIMAIQKQLFTLFEGGFSAEAIISWIVWILALTLAVSLHEVAHGYAAYRLGDTTAYELGRLTLNPIAHFDLFGALLILMRAPIAWAKPVPINPRRFNGKVKHKTAMIIVALAGIVTNLVTSALAYFIQGLIRFIGVKTGQLDFYQAIPYSNLFLSAILLFFSIFSMLSIWLAIFNLLPVPPLDGFKFIGQFLPHKIYYWLLEHERQIGLVFIILIVFGRGILGRVLSVVAVPVTYVIQKPIDLLFLMLLGK